MLFYAHLYVPSIGSFKDVIIEIVFGAVMRD